MPKKIVYAVQAAENLPVRTTIPVALDGFDIEVDAILYIGE